MPTLKTVDEKSLFPETSKPIEIGNIDQLGIGEFESVIQRLLLGARFDDLDRIASEARAKKSRFQGGSWKLKAFYDGLCNVCTVGTPEQMSSQIARFKRWVAAKPESVTARVALAHAYYAWAWDARGGAFADLVDENAWKAFNERIQTAREILEQASQLKEKCPEWFLMMEKIGRSQSWEMPELNRALQAAASFEPLYFYYYQDHAFTLQPRWGGTEGDSERFAGGIADNIGGKEGAVVYFKMAADLYCVVGSESETAFSHISWPRVKEGYEVTKELYGISSVEQNQMLMMAAAARDHEMALKLALEIGDNWDRSVWKKRSNYQETYSWSLAMPDEIMQEWQLNAQNTRNPAGMGYYQQAEIDFDKKNATAVKQCSEETKGDKTAFLVGMKLDAVGAPQEMNAWPPNKFSACLMPKLKDIVLAPPPSSGYWIFLEVNSKPLKMLGTGVPNPDVGY